MRSPATVRAILAHSFPNCFKGKGRIKLPLKIGIHNDILSSLPSLTEAEISAAITDYISGPKYLDRMVAGAWRVDLAGDPTTKVKVWEAEHAKQRLANLRAGWANNSEGQSLGDILKHALDRSSQTMSNDLLPKSPMLSTASQFVDNHWNGSRVSMGALLQDRDRENISYGYERGKIDGIGKYPSASTVADMLSAIKTGRKIDAIKAHRALTVPGSRTPRTPSRR